jgi:hypothetical protein
MSIHQRFAVFCGFCLLSIPCSAQQGIFDDPAGLFGEPAEDAKPVVENETSDDPLTKQLLEDAQRGDLQLANAIASFARLGRWSEVNRLLARLAGKNIDSKTLAEMSQRLGPALFLQIKQREELGGPARAGLEKLAEAAVAQAESPERLRSAINDLGSQSIDKRLAAARLLLGGGNFAVSELVAAAVSENSPAPGDDVLRTLLEFGNSAIQALRQLALYGTPPVRHRALQSLARIDRQASTVELVTALHAADSSEAEIETARTNLQRMDGIPSRASSLQILTLDFADKQNRALLTDNDDQTMTLWSVNPQRNRVTHQTTIRMLGAYRDVADAAARLRRVGGLSPATEGATLAADMAYRIMVDPDWGDPEQIEAIHNAYGVSASGPALSAAIARSIEDSDHTATIGLMRLIDPNSASVLDRSRLLIGNGALPTPLVQAASSPEPQVRYDAALLVSRLAHGKPFPGSSYVRACLGEMYALSDRPSAILVETRADVIIPLEVILGDLGFDVNVVGSVSELQRVVARGGDLRLILSKTELADFSPIEMTDLIRRTNRGRQLPIVFYGAEPPGLVTARWQAPTVWIDRPASAAGLDALRDMVKRKRRLPPLSIIDRQTYRDASTQLLDQSAQAG